MKYRNWLCAALALGLMVSGSFALSEDVQELTGEDLFEEVFAANVEDEQMEAEEFTFSLTEDISESAVPATPEQPSTSQSADVLEEWDESDYIISYPDVCDKAIRQLVKPSERVYPGTLIWPLKGREPLEHVTSHVGWRNAGRIHAHQGGSFPSWLHHGIDIGGVGTDQVVVAADGGRAYAGEKSGLGKYVVIDHGNGWYTRVQHLSGYAGQVSPMNRGVTVEAGEPIGYVGGTGGDYPVHFHFEIAFSPDGPGGDDTDYQRETHSFHIRAYSFPQNSVVLLRWADRWEICTAENQTFVKLEDEAEEAAVQRIE